MAPSENKPPTRVELIWEHDLVFAGKSDDVRMTLDSASAEGPSPMQAVAFGLAGCMAMDVVHVVKKARHELRGLRADLLATRSPEVPHRFTSVELHFTATGTIPQEVMERAIQLSRDKYCSVWHSLRQDIPLDVTFTLSEGI